ncbi:MlaD family protein [Halodesulfovibrio aestuarii]|uniref:MlaD family protein n=1 Tax=Halodesulfovibrio aestuarii TaxID=126333 RepID=A0A8G2FGI2_9BACT|nr:MlaD family protein [Halodesulfovibrio aestuarii]SHI54262.1 phospholipid/cholesterol/gamma-HCH transport system substrate-binding protein [Halodesulfovibrio aestuarii]
METRAHFIIVGVFIISAFVFGFGFILWGAGNSSDSNDLPYDIMFLRSVNGLSISNPVLLNGVRVGKVTAIMLNKDKPEEIRVRILVTRGTPIRDDSKAKLIPIGITGQSAVFISGGTATSPLLKPLYKGNIPLIKTVPSPINELISALPEMLTTGKKLLEDLRKVVDPENRKNVKDFLANIASFSNLLVKSEADIQTALDNIKNAAAQTQHAMSETEKTALSVHDYVSTQLTPATNKIGILVKRIDLLVKNMEPGLTRFSKSGLDDLTSLVNESRTLVDTLENIAQKLNSNPKQFLLGKTVPEYQTP